MLVAGLQREVTLRTHAGINPVQVLNLKCDSGSELVALAEEREFALTAITCLDEDTTALRAARARLDKRLPTKQVSAGQRDAIPAEPHAEVSAL